jgi:hypothetical protein
MTLESVLEGKDLDTTHRGIIHMLETFYPSLKREINSFRLLSDPLYLRFLFLVTLFREKALQDHFRPQENEAKLDMFLASMDPSIHRVLENNHTIEAFIAECRDGWAIA